LKSEIHDLKSSCARAYALRIMPAAAMCLALVAQLLVLQGPAVSERVSEERMITFVKGIPARAFDAALPKIRLERWLMDVAGKANPLRWELNDCGEQTGDPAIDPKRDIPACVEAAADLPGERSFSVQIQVGTFGGKTQKPALRGIYVLRARRIHEVQKLRDLPRQLEAAKPQ
jgi:hypothetical protein